MLVVAKSSAAAGAPESRDGDERQVLALPSEKQDDPFDRVDAYPPLDSYDVGHRQEILRLIRAEMAAMASEDKKTLSTYMTTETQIPASMGGQVDESISSLWKRDLASLSEALDSQLASSGAQGSESKGFRKIDAADLDGLREAAAKARVPRLDLIRYDCVEPSESASLAEWGEATRNVKAQLEHSETRLINLQLSLKYAKDAWLKHIENLQAVEKQMQHKVDEMKEQFDRVVRERRLNQLVQSDQLRLADLQQEKDFERNLKIATMVFERRQKEMQEAIPPTE